MLTSTNKAGIRASLKQWSQRKQIPNDVLDDFIEISLSKANRGLRIPPLEAFTTIEVSTTGYAQLPADFIEVKELSVLINGNTHVLSRKDISEVDTVANSSSAGGYPCIFGRFGNYLKIAPWSLAEGSIVSLYYYFAIPSMTDDTSSNWFTQYSPDTILYGALAELSDYTRDPEGSAMWAAKFRESINILQAVEDKSAWSGSTLSVSLNGSTSAGRAAY